VSLTGQHVSQSGAWMKSWGAADLVIVSLLLFVMLSPRREGD
jgi:hypothetical protein